MIRQNHWAKITDNHWVHPDIGFVKCNWGPWEAHPKAIFGEGKSFETFEEAIRYMEKLIK